MGQDPKTQRVRALGKGSSRHLGLPAKGLGGTCSTAVMRAATEVPYSPAGLCQWLTGGPCTDSRAGSVGLRHLPRRRPGLPLLFGCLH